MAGKKRAEIRDRDVTGLKYFDKLAPRKPTLRTYEMICFYFCGMATEAELMAQINKL
jgi:hypothetical protein